MSEPCQHPRTTFVEGVHCCRVCFVEVPLGFEAEPEREADEEHPAASNSE